MVVAHIKYDSTSSLSSRNVVCSFIGSFISSIANCKLFEYPLGTGISFKMWFLSIPMLTNWFGFIEMKNYSCILSLTSLYIYVCSYVLYVLCSVLI